MAQAAAKIDSTNVSSLQETHVLSLSEHIANGYMTFLNVAAVWEVQAS